MKIKWLAALLMVPLGLSAQTAVQSVNSGSIISPASAVSIGEIVVVPDNPSQPQTGIIGIMAQVNGLQLEVAELDFSDAIKVYPNPTVSSIHFSGSDLSGKAISVFDASGKHLSDMTIEGNAADLSQLASGIYLIRIENTKTFKIVKH